MSKECTPPSEVLCLPVPRVECGIRGYIRIPVAGRLQLTEVFPTLFTFSNQQKLRVRGRISAALRCFMNPCLRDVSGLRRSAASDAGMLSCLAAPCLIFLGMQLFSRS